MGILSRKPRCGTEEFCREFYDSEIFHAIIAGTDAAQVLLDNIFTSVAEADRLFAAVDRAIFRREMTALRLELFGLAWMHHFKTRDKYTLPQSVFTRDYLSQAGRKEIWDIMGDYNQAIAGSGEFDSTGKRVGRVRLTYMNEFSFNWMDSVMKGSEVAKGSGREAYLVCVARVANRMFAGAPNSRSVILDMLTSTLAERLGCDPNHLNNQAAFRVAAFTFGMYRGAKEAIQEVDIRA